MACTIACISFASAEQCERSTSQLVLQGKESAMAIYGDTPGTFDDHEVGGNQDIVLENNIDGVAYGDADQMVDHSRGGDDMLTGGQFTTNTLYGDANAIRDHASGGNDTLIGVGLIDNLFGDAYTLSDHAAGGADTLTMG